MFRAFWKKFSDFIRRVVSCSASSFALFMSILFLTLAYRVQLAVGLFTSPIKPFDFHPDSHPVWFILAYWSYDLAVALGCFLLFGLLSQGRFFLPQGKVSSSVKVAGVIFLQLLLIVILFVHDGHIRLLFDVQSGFDSSIILETAYNISYRDILKFLEIRDYLFILLPIGVFWLVLRSPANFRVGLARISVVGILFLSFLSLFAAHAQKDRPPAEIRLNPALFFLSDVAENNLFQKREKDRPTDWAQENGSGLQPTGPMYVHPVKSVKMLPAKSDQKWNVIFVVLESVGTRYMFDTQSGNPMPMPFLQKLAQEGWFLKKHHTTSNVSTKAVFSIFSGLYDLFHRGALGLRPDGRVPSLFNFLEGYDGFLVSPSSSSWYFPAQFIKNSGLPEVFTYENLNFRVREELHSLGRYIARDEIQTVDFFLQRVSKAREPFLGIYISFAAHFPYFDYGPDYRIKEEDGRLISRYYNNLSLLDRMAQRIYDHLQKKGLLERTILVIMGDHGQAFGQHHPDNYLHYRYSYEENLETPVILYQPALFRPRVIEFPTSHVDLLPTLLDAMRIPYHPSLLDGESLFQRKLKRRYIFFYGHEESISALDTDRIKVQVSLKKNRCWAFDLKADPEEKNPLDCSSYSPQLEALRRFVAHHDSSLVQYHARLKEGKDFQGHRHPTLTQSAKSIGQSGR